ncbi:ABC transporter permease [Natronocalculus amylovorans]|uniref:ABC transporter permease n=1 Tax=Natronocalculus amylovorans TaxID=2917812 RepID=A0AAE3FZQ8_9EURY|nr:ABC transporter permease [Natronocalculus amylovorans]MCL9818190.1 ABC transporter permease [Natronocalculus amylovorans]NUE03750.1 ABC transporter permease [Halorubraceae archaeon YAN]
MAHADPDTQADVEQEPVDDEFEAKVGLSYTLAKVKQDTTARLGMYIVGAVIFLAAFVTIDSNISTLTFGRIDNFVFAENVLGNHPERHPPAAEAETTLPPFFADGGVLSHPLGTDIYGRDYFTRLIYGSQVSVTVGIVATGIGLIGGTIVGAVSGYYGGWIDDVFMRTVEILYSIPALVLVIVFTVFVSGGRPDIQYAVIGVGIAFIPVFARLIRSRVLSVREMDYIEAARASGVRDRNIILRHVIPNSFAPVLVLATLQIGVTILIVAGLSFLGYGAQPPTADWGQMLSSARGFMLPSPWLSIWPGLAILVTIMGFNLLGDGLQDALDPRIKD